jgi:hypothetical protein
MATNAGPIPAMDIEDCTLANLAFGLVSGCAASRELEWVKLRVSAELKNWRILRKIRSSPSRASELVTAVQTLMIANT